MAIPAAAVTSCCSAMPTSMKRSGERASKGRSPVGPGHRSGERHDPVVVLGRGEQRPGEGVGVGGRLDVARLVHVRDRGGRPADLVVVEALDLVLLGGCVAPALLGEDVDDDRAVPAGGAW